RHGIRFTILAPHQCARVKSLADIPPTNRTATEPKSAEPTDTGWKETPDASVDTTQPYLVQTSAGHSIAVFSYNGPVSRAIAFDGLLNSGEAFAERLMGGFNEGNEAQLVHVATDGESYGHHHRHGEMALAYTLQLIEEGDAKLTNYGQFLAKFPPTSQAQIV